MPTPAGFNGDEMLALRQLRDIDDLNGLIQIMAFLYRYKTGTISNFIKDLRLNQQPVYRTIKRLEQLEIIRSDLSSTTRDETTAAINYELTELGLKLAKPFNDLARIYSKSKRRVSPI